MRSPHQIAIAFLYVLLASNPVLAETPIGNAAKTSMMVDASGCTLRPSSPLILNGALRLNAAGISHQDARPTAGALKAAGTSEPPGPGSPSIPGGPGPPPDDDDDDGGDAEFST
jgi:hypothetical protein